MDVIALSKAKKAKKAIQNLNTRLGEGVQDVYANVKTRLEELEKKDPHVTLNNRVSEVETNTAVNLNKHNLHVNTILNKNKFGLTDLVFDDFADDSGVDKTKSSGQTFDSTGKKLTIASGQTQAQVVTTAESLSETPQFVTVSQAFNEQTTASKNADLTNGVFTNVDLVNGKLQLHVNGTQNAGYTSNLIPAMTSDTSPSGKVIYSSQYFNAYHAFDGIKADANYGYSFEATGTSCWIGYTFPSAKKIAMYTIESVPETTAGSKRAPKNWTFEGSNDGGATWVVLDTQSNITFALGEKKSFYISSPATFTSYRVNITSNNGDASYTAISEIEMMESTTQSLYSASGSYESPILDIGTNLKTLKNINDVMENIITMAVGTLAPKMTANNIPTPYVAAASSIYAAQYDAWKAFDGICGGEGGWVSANNVLTGWLSFDLSQPAVISQYAITSRYSNYRGDLKNWTFEGSNDNSTWAVLHTVTNEPAWGSKEKRTYTAMNTKAYRYYRINVSAIYSVNATYVSIGQLELINNTSPTSLTISTATSSDGVTFSSYQPLNADGTIASPSARYLKVKASFVGGGQAKASTPFDFVAGDAASFQANDKVVFDGSLHMKTAYSYAMNPDASFTDTGTLLRKSIDKSIFKTIEKVSVV